MELGFHPSRHGDRLVPNLSQRPLFLGRDCWWGSRTFLRSIHLGTDPTVAGGENKKWSEGRAKQIRQDLGALSNGAMEYWRPIGPRKHSPALAWGIEIVSGQV